MPKAQGKCDGQTGTKILLEAMSKDKDHLARFVLDALDGEIVDSKTEGALTPLIAAVSLPESHTRSKFVWLLLRRGADVNCRDRHGRTALSFACEKGYLDAVKILVQNNADPEIVDARGNTALMYAAVGGHSSAVEFLVRAFKRLGLQVDRRNKAGNSAVEMATSLGHTECIFALTNSSKKGRKGNWQWELNFECMDIHDKSERKVVHLVKKLETFPETCNHAQCRLDQKCNLQPQPIKKKRLPSMDSIDEFERENDCLSPAAHELLFSEILPPRPPAKATVGHLPLLTLSCETQKQHFFSPRPRRNPPKPCGAPSVLGIPLTIIQGRKSETEPCAEQRRVSDSGVRRFPESYYQKRSSLPASVLSPAPPERTLEFVRKSRASRRCEASPCGAESLPLTASSPTAFSVLSNKLLRRFTSPEFKKDVKDSAEDPVLTPGRMKRSETFPQSATHPQVDSKPSIDSISSVNCEFDFHSRMPNS